MQRLSTIGIGQANIATTNDGEPIVPRKPEAPVSEFLFPASEKITHECMGLVKRMTTASIRVKRRGIIGPPSPWVDR